MGRSCLDGRMKIGWTGDLRSGLGGLNRIVS